MDVLADTLWCKLLEVRAALKKTHRVVLDRRVFFVERWGRWVAPYFHPTPMFLPRLKTSRDNVQLPGARGATRHGKPQFGDESLCHATGDVSRRNGA